jgi:hypothetical protein
MPMALYTPPDKVVSTLPHEIIALLGAPGVGKSVSTLTFPNRYFGDFDHKVPIGELSTPCWDATWTVNTMKMEKPQGNSPANWRDATRKWLRTQLPLFSPEQTYIHDSWTQHIFMASLQIRVEDAQQAKANKFYFYQELKKYCEEIASFLKAAPCRIVATFHETPEWLEGEPTGKIKPVQDGQFKDQMFSIFSDVWRCLNGIRVRGKDAGGKTTFTTIEGRYWQVQGDASFDANANSLLAPLLRKYGIKYVKTWIDPKTNTVCGGYNEIQRIYREENLKVENEILLPPTI